MGTVKKHAALIAGTHSGAGKTTWTLALSLLAKSKGLTVQPFKAGPDYIDIGFHNAVSSRVSRNLDLFLLSENSIQESFRKNSADADFSVVEGVMGLFDGEDFKGKSSSAEIAKRLGIPVFLIIDGSGMAASAAAIVMGFKTLDPEVRLAGVFFNRVNHESHYQHLKQAVEYRTQVPCFGYLPLETSIAIPERHLGLTSPLELSGLEKRLEKVRELASPLIDWAGFWNACEFSTEEFPKNQTPQSFSRPFHIAVAKDNAFSFYYEDNFDFLKEAGAKISFFSPLNDAQIPRADLVYFGGGFPEVYTKTLSSNTEMLSAVRNYYRSGGWIYAECGGLMYLSHAFCSAEGLEFPLTGLIPGKTRMTNRLQHFGYHEIQAAPENFLFSPGEKGRSHEYHYSVWDEEGKHAPAYIIGERKEGYVGERIVASYQHLHFGTISGFAGSLIHRIVKERNFVC